VPSLVQKCWDDIPYCEHGSHRTRNCKGFARFCIHLKQVQVFLAEIAASHITRTSQNDIVKKKIIINVFKIFQNILMSMINSSYVGNYAIGF